MRYEHLHLAEYYPVLGNNNCDPTLDLYLQDPPAEIAKANPKRPSILVCPGGAYFGCSIREAEPIALHFLPEGYQVFVLSYSCAPNRYPTQLREVAAAMELIHANADAWDCDPTRIAIIGFSAGGHLAAHYSTSYDCAAVREIFPDSKPVQASILSYPVITAAKQFSDQSNRGTFCNLLGHFPETDEEINAVSCEMLVSKKTPPTFLWHTNEDAGVPVMNTLLYAQALSKYNIPMEVHIYPEGRHGLSTVDAQTCEELTPAVSRAKHWLDEVKQWLSHTL